MIIPDLDEEEFSESDESSVLSNDVEEIKLIQDTPLTAPYNQDYIDDRSERENFKGYESSTVNKLSFDHFGEVPNGIVTNSGPTTVDFNGLTPIRQLITKLPPFGEFQIVTTYELCPLAQIVWEIQQVNAQVLYYFSKNNLLRDVYLRSLMNKEGFVPIKIFSEFPRIKKLLPKLLLAEQRTKVLVNSFRLSVPEVFDMQEDKVRLKESWKMWLL